MCVMCNYQVTRLIFLGNLQNGLEGDSHLELSMCFEYNSLMGNRYMASQEDSGRGTCEAGGGVEGSSPPLPLCVSLYPITPKVNICLLI